MILFMIISFIVLMILGIPVFISTAIPVIVYFIFEGPDYIMIRVMAGGVNNYSLLAIPLFILAAEIMNACGITEALFNFCEVICDPLKGGLGHANVVASVIFAGMSGSAVADASSLGLVEIKAMRMRGYDESFTIGVTGSSSIIGPIIPPSIVMIVYAVVNDISVGRLFAGGILPGLLMGLSLMIMIYLLADKFKCPPPRSFSAKEIFYAFKKGFWAIFTPVIILGGMFGGLFTPTEASAIATLYSIFLGIIVYKKLTLKRFYSAMKDTTLICAKILVIIAFSCIFGWVLAKEQVPQAAATLILSFTKGNYYLTLLLINVLLIIVGMFLDQTPAIIILSPILMPIAGNLGINPYHFGVMVVLNLMIGALTPPFGQVLFALAGITDYSVEYIVKSVFIWIFPLIIVLIMVTLFPQITLIIPSLIYK